MDIVCLCSLHLIIPFEISMTDYSDNGIHPSINPHLYCRSAKNACQPSGLRSTIHQWWLLRLQWLPNQLQNQTSQLAQPWLENVGDFHFSIVASPKPTWSAFQIQNSQRVWQWHNNHGDYSGGQRGRGLHIICPDGPVLQVQQLTLKLKHSSISYIKLVLPTAIASCLLSWW